MRNSDWCRWVRAGLLGALLAAASMGACGQEVYCEHGNIWFRAGDAPPRQLTATGNDTLPAWSSTSHVVAYVHLTPEDGGRDLWTVHQDGTGARRVVTGSESDDPKKNLTGIENLWFSPDGRRVYFDTEAWATSFAVHVVDLGTLAGRFVTDGGLHSVIPKGEHKGFLIVQKHRYFVGGGSYDWYWVVNPETGGDVGPLGASPDAFYEMLEARPEK